ncbi:MAG: hypothetical protein ACJ79R_04400 [Anaeromyxobacteraceae bacterium]
MLLVAGAARDTWAGALAAAGFEVRTVDWLDAVTAARVRRPDAVVIADDLPGRATDVLRSALAGDLNTLPVVMAGAPPNDPVRAEMDTFRYVSAPTALATVGAVVTEAMRAGRPRKALPSWWWLELSGGLVLAAGLIVGSLSSWIERRTPGAGRAVLGGATAFAVAGAAAALFLAIWRRSHSARMCVKHAWIFLVMLLPAHEALFGTAPATASFSASLALMSASAWLARDAKPRSPAARRWLLAVAIALLLAAAARWVALIPLR